MYHIHLSRPMKRAMMLAADSIMIPAALWCAFALRYGTWEPLVGRFAWLFPLATLLGILIFIRMGLYRAIVRHMGSQVAFTVLHGVTILTLALAALAYMIYVKPRVPRSVFIIFWLLSVLYIGGSRFSVRAYFQWLKKNYRSRKKIAIYGAGDAGTELALILLNSKEFLPVAFIDDNRSLQGSIIHGLKVFSAQEVKHLVAKLEVIEIFLALPAATKMQRKSIIERLEAYPVHVRSVPSMPEVISGRARLEDVRELDVEDLLGRDSVAPQPDLLARCIKDKVVMVTGAAGSIGSELCRQIIKQRPACLILYEISEYGLYSLDRELRGVIEQEALVMHLVSLLGSVQDLVRVTDTIKRFNVHTIYHAAAYKHVPIVEDNLVEGIKNNTLGTWIVAEAAGKLGIESFVLVSTDKAVRPTNVMGATKRFAELILQALNTKYQETRYSAVRFGNVLNSSGSVVPLFREQIKAGGPVTVTHPEVIRYFMTIPEAAQLVIQAGAMAQGGDIFVLNMGEPVRIAQLAERMVHLMGYAVKQVGNSEGDIEIVYTGLRPGEKLYEELLIGDQVTGTAHPMIMRAEEQGLSLEELEQRLMQLQAASEAYDYVALLQLLQQSVQGYQPAIELQNLLTSGSKEKANSKVYILYGKDS